MKKIITSCMAALLALSSGFAAVAADEVPEARLVAPLDGTEAVYQIIVMWGGIENVVTEGTMKATITTPSGVSQEYKGNLAVEYPDDKYPDSGPIEYSDAFQVRNLNWDPVEFTGGYKEEGRYTVTIPQGTVKVNGIDNPEAVLYFTVVAADLPYAESNPTNGNFVGGLDMVELSWGTPVAAARDESSMLVTVKINGEAAGDAPCFVWNSFPGDFEPWNADAPAPAADDTQFGNVLMVDLGEIISWDTTGVVQFTLPSEMVVNEAGKYNKSQNFEFTLLKTNYSDTWTPDPFETGDAEYVSISTSDVVTVEWNDVIDLNPYAENTVVAIDAATDNVVMSFFKDENMTVGTQSLTVDISGLEKSGLYRFEVPAGFLLVGNDYINGDAGATYYITAGPEVSPVPGTYSSLNDIQLSWKGQSLTPGENFDPEKLQLTVTNATLSDNPQVSIIDQYGEPVYPQYEGGSSEEGIALSISNWFVITEEDDNWNPLPYSLEFTIPAGMVKINDTAINEELTLKYNIVPIYVDYTTTPTKASMMPSISEIVIKWDGTEGYTLDINPRCKDKVTYGEQYGPQFPVESVTAQEDGTVLVKLGETYDELGWMNIQVPDYYLMAVKDGEKVILGEQSFNYQIALYTVYPASFNYVFEAFDTFTIAATLGSIELAGNVADITMTDGENKIGMGKSATPTEFDGMSALEIALDTPFTKPGTAYVTIPAGMFKLNGTLYEQPINLEYYVNPPVPDATVKPESGSTVNKIDVIEVDWDKSPLQPNEFYEYDPENEFGDMPFTIQCGDEEPVVINDLVSIENVYGENSVAGEYVESSTLVINFGEHPYTAKGDYMVTIPAMYVIVENYNYDVNPETIIIYTVSGEGLVNFLEAEADGYWRVYDLNGVNVLNTNDGDVLKTLERGIYIVNGKKVIIK